MIFDIDSIQIEKSNGFNKYNEPLPPTVITKNGFFDQAIKTVKDDEGRIQTISGMIRFSPRDLTLTLSDIFIIGGRRYNVLEIKQPKDFTRTVTEVYLQ